MRFFFAAIWLCFFSWVSVFGQTRFPVCAPSLARFVCCVDVGGWKAYEAKCYDLDYKPPRKIKEWKQNAKFEIKFGLSDKNYAKIFHKAIVQLLHKDLNLPWNKCMIYLGTRTMAIVSWEVSLGELLKLFSIFCDTKTCEQNFPLLKNKKNKKKYVEEVLRRNTQRKLVFSQQRKKCVLFQKRNFDSQFWHKKPQNSLSIDCLFLFFCWD